MRLAWVLEVEKLLQVLYTKYLLGQKYYCILIGHYQTSFHETQKHSNYQVNTENFLGGLSYG